MANTHSGSFDGTGDWALKNSPTGLPSGSSARTIECWVKTSTGTERYPLGYGSTGAFQAFDFAVLANSIGIRINGANHFWTATNVTDGNWHHIALSYVSGADISHTTNVLAYMDGSLLTTSSSAAGTPNTVLTRLYAAAESSNGASPSLPFNGLVDEIRIWDAVRSSTEINDNMSVELTGSETNLVGYWKMNNNWNDSDANANDLTAAGGATFSTTVPFTGAATSFEIQGHTLLTLGVG